jgi:uncharacterized membrane protein
MQMPGRLIVAALAVAAGAWFALVVLAPVLPPALAALIYAAGSIVCHQLPERSYHWHGAQLAVCARCTGLYLGACSAALLAPLPPSIYVAWANSRKRIGWLLAGGGLPIAATVAAEWLGIWTPSADVRAVTGVIAGVAGAIIIAGALNYGECLPRAAAVSRPPQTPI